MTEYPINPIDRAGQVTDLIIPRRKANYIIDFATAPCSAPWWVYVETLLPAFLKLIITFVTLEWDDVVRHVGRRRSGHQRRRAMRNAKVFDPTWTNGANKAFWRLDGIIQRGLWWWMVIDLTVDGFYQWTTLINETAYCTGGGSFQLEQFTSAQACGPNYLPFQLTHLVENTNNWSWNTTFVRVPAGRTFAMLIMKIQANGALNNGGDFFLEISADSILTHETQEVGPIQLVTGEETEVGTNIHFTADALSPVTITWRWKQGPAPIPLIQINEAFLMVGQYVEPT
jgi:hypothetical protein